MIGRPKSIGTAVAVSVVLLCLSACGAKPRHQSLRTDNPSSVQFVLLPVDAQVFVDGRQVQPALGSQGTANVAVVDGMREIRVVRNGSDIYKETIFIQDGTTKRIIIGK